MILLKKITGDYNWLSSLGNKKNQRENVRGEEDWLLLGSFCPACLRSSNEPPHLWGRLAPVLFYAQSLTSGKRPKSTGNEISNDVDYSRFQPSERSGNLSFSGWGLTCNIFTDSHHWASREYVTCTAGLVFSDYRILDSQNYFHFLILKCPQASQLALPLLALPPMRVSWALPLFASSWAVKKMF